MIWLKDIDKDIKDLLQRMDKLEMELIKRDLLTSDLQKKLQNSTPFEERVITLEIWQKKLSELMIAKTPTGKETLSPFGRKLFGGKSKGF